MLASLCSCAASAGLLAATSGGFGGMRGGEGELSCTRPGICNTDAASLQSSLYHQYNPLSIINTILLASSLHSAAAAAAIQTSRSSRRTPLDPKLTIPYGPKHMAKA